MVDTNLSCLWWILFFGVCGGLTLVVIVGGSVLLSLCGGLSRLLVVCMALHCAMSRLLRVCRICSGGPFHFPF